MKSSTPNINRREFLKKSALGAIGIMAIPSVAGTYSRYIEPGWIEIKKVAIGLANLPKSFHSFRIVHFGDLHLGFHMTSSDLKSIVQEIQSLQPDMICFSGDLVDHSPDVLEASLPILAQLQAPFGQYAVLGNHDSFGNRQPVTNGLTEAGFQVLHNQHVAVRKGEETLYVAGVDDPWVGKPDIERALDKIPNGACTLLLAHEPDFADDYSQYPIDLQLSGHSHGGQVRLPFMGALYTPPLGSKYCNGLYRVENSALQVYTTRGLGMTRLPFRFNCRPELTLLTLKQT